MNKRVFNKSEIAAFAREGASNDMCVIMRSTGEVEMFPAIHRRGGVGDVDTTQSSKAEMAFDNWRATRVGKNVRHP